MEREHENAVGPIKPAPRAGAAGAAHGAASSCCRASTRLPCACRVPSGRHAGRGSGGTGVDCRASAQRQLQRAAAELEHPLKNIANKLESNKRLRATGHDIINKAVLVKARTAYRREAGTGYARRRYGPARARTN